MEWNELAFDSDICDTVETKTLFEGVISKGSTSTVKDIHKYTLLFLTLSANEGSEDIGTLGRAILVKGNSSYSVMGVVGAPYGSHGFSWINTLKCYINEDAFRLEDAVSFRINNSSSFISDWTQLNVKKIDAAIVKRIE